MIGSAVFAQLDAQTDRHTDHVTCDSCSCCTHLRHCVLAMWPEKLRVNFYETRGINTYGSEKM